MPIRALVALLTCLGAYVDSGRTFCGRQYRYKQASAFCYSM